MAFLSKKINFEKIFEIKYPQSSQSRNGEPLCHQIRLPYSFLHYFGICPDYIKYDSKQRQFTVIQGSIVLKVSLVNTFNNRFHIPSWLYNTRLFLQILSIIIQLLSLIYLVGMLTYLIELKKGRLIIVMYRFMFVVYVSQNLVFFHFMRTRMSRIANILNTLDNLVYTERLFEASSSRISVSLNFFHS